MYCYFFFLLITILISVIFSFNGDDYYKMAEEIKSDGGDYIETATMYWNALLLSTGIYFAKCVRYFSLYSLILL